MKKETIDLLLKEAQKECEIEIARGYKAEVVYLPCVVSYNKDGETLGGVQFPSSSTIFQNENN